MVTKHVPHAKCPHCHGMNTRLIPRATGESPELRHWVCDPCKIGWYIVKGAPFKGWGYVDIESARKAYVPAQKGGAHAGSRS
jgi:hypothetical protein